METLLNGLDTKKIFDTAETSAYLVLTLTKCNSISNTRDLLVHCDNY